MFYTIHAVSKDRSIANAIPASPRDPTPACFSSRIMRKMLEITEERLVQVAFGCGQTYGLIITAWDESNEVVPLKQIKVTRYINQYKSRYIMYDEEGTLSKHSVRERLFGVTAKQLEEMVFRTGFHFKRPIASSLPKGEEVATFGDVSVMISTSLCNKSKL